MINFHAITEQLGEPWNCFPAKRAARRATNARSFDCDHETERAVDRWCSTDQRPRYL